MKVELVYASTGGEQHLELGELVRDVIGWHPGRQEAYLLGIANIGPYPKVDMRRLRAEHIGPYTAAYWIGLVDKAECVHCRP